MSSAHCVSSTTRVGADKGFNVFPIYDATATFDQPPVKKAASARAETSLKEDWTDPDGKLRWSANLVHEIAMAELASFGDVLETKEVLEFL
jgi:hypothetical protein